MAQSACAAPGDQMVEMSGMGEALLGRSAGAMRPDPVGQVAGGR
jgi:hypothetical protein